MWAFCVRNLVIGSITPLNVVLVSLILPVGEVVQLLSRIELIQPFQVLSANKDTFYIYDYVYLLSLAGL